MDRIVSHPIDMMLYGEEYGTPEMRAIFSEENLIQKWLFMDAALAEVEGEMGIIPLEAAQEIKKKAMGGYVKVSRVAELAKGKGLDIAAELSALAEVCEKGAGEFIRIGSAGIDNYETAWGLLIKDALAVILRDLDRWTDVLADLTRKYRNTLCVARTFGQHEGPITFGYKTAAWAMELHHCRRILIEGQRDYLIGKATGTIGNLASLEKFYPGKALALQREVCLKLGLEESDLTILFSRRRQMQIVVNLTYIANAIDNIAMEIFNRQRPEIGELQEPFGEHQVASTASPHKRNPYGCNILSGLAEVVRGNAATILRCPWSDERDHRRMPVESSVIPSTFIFVSGMLRKAIFICGKLVVHPERMLENLSLLKGLNLSETIGTALASRGLGRYTAYALMREMAQQVTETGKDFRELLKNHKTVREYLTDREIDEHLDFSSNLGIVQAQIDATLSAIGR